MLGERGRLVIDADQIEAAIMPRTKAIVTVTFTGTFPKWTDSAVADT
jgi:dTDP-4-amino-4,6-dideoxygalactose transaminase